MRSSTSGAGQHRPSMQYRLQARHMQSCQEYHSSRMSKIAGHYTSQRVSSRRVQRIRAAFKPQNVAIALYDAERLRLDQQARDAMTSQAAAETAAEAAAPGSKDGAWKWAIRKRIWDYMEESNIARLPRPVHHRIPNFVHAETAAELLATLPEFNQGKVIKVNPDTPQKMVRYQVLSNDKTLPTPQPRLRTGFFSTLSASDIPSESLMEACTSAGLAKWGNPVGLDEQGLKVDMIVVGSSAVSPNGARLGKGEVCDV
eukprot:GHRR01027340.1.p1 GENE.GHRR01027340.1~~GHRR01027340.1.p1  ORF type:complete len:257 (+),score=52.43 GHRR01027340.1:165-935(+)